MPKETAIGSKFGGRYSVIDKLGEGGMSVVWLARDMRLEKLWAVKEVKKNNNDPVSQIDFGLMRREANIMRNLDHPNIVHVVDVIDEDDSMYVVMDYVQGRDLADIMRERARTAPDGVYAYPEEDVIHWGIQLCDALGYLHNQTPPIIYRDMKPGNVMVQANGKIKIIDFGIAREFKSNKELDTRPLGTRGFASPEAVENVSQTDARSDIYSLGVTLFHLVTGHSPMEYVTQPNLPPIRSINPQLSPSLEATIIRATQWDPDARQQSMAELRYELENPVEPEHQRWMEQTLARFKFFSITGAICIVLGLGCLLGSTAVRKSAFDDIMARAAEADTSESSGNVSEAEELYLRAIEINPDSIEPYQELVDRVYKKDNVFSLTESERWNDLFLEHRDQLEKHYAYGKLCYDVGIDYFIYFNYGDELNRGDMAVVWFARALKGNALNEKERAAAQNYLTISSFQRSIQKATVEGGDRQAYLDYFKALSGAVAEATDADTIAQLRLYNVAAHALGSQLYVSGFVRSGVAEKDAVALLDQVTKQTESLSEVCKASFATDQLYEEVIKACEKAQENVKTVYAQSGTGKEAVAQ